MKKIRGVSSFVFVLAAIWVLSMFANVQARAKGQEKDKSEKEKLKNEKMIEKEKGDKDKSRNKIKYKPVAMTDKDLMEWTDGNPPGWSRGSKTGWGGAGAPPGQMKEHEQERTPVYPRGSENWDARRKEDWDKKLGESKARILERIRAKEGMSPEDEESAIISLEGAARKGVPLEHVEAAMGRTINRGMRGRDIEKVTRAMSYGADKDTDYNRLNQVIKKRISERETGNDLALSIYKEIDEQHAAKPEVSLEKPWWKRLFGM